MNGKAKRESERIVSFGLFPWIPLQRRTHFYFVRHLYIDEGSKIPTESLFCFYKLKYQKINRFLQVTLLNPISSAIV